MDKRTLRSKKSKVRNTRTYDRQNQSIFGKVCSTVKGLLNPSWLLNNVSQWIGNSEQEPGNIENETIEETDNDIISQSVSHGNKRLRLRLDDYVPSIQNSGTQTWPEHTSTQNLYPSPQNSLLSTKESLAGLNGDNHSENSEGSASTSGCSSLVSSNNRLMESPFQNLRSDMKNNRKRREAEPSKSSFADVNSSRTLWSSPSARFQRRLPIISSTNQPNFNLSSFVGPSKLINAVENKVSSPFYEGKTTFGGASSRKIPQSLAPYQVIDKTLRNQIKVRENPPEDGLEGMSSAAKRILLTLEKMSTPVADAKKIPNSNTSPVDLSLYLAPPKSRRNSQFTPSISKGPPIANINTIAKLATLKNYGIKRRLQSAVLSSPVIPPDQTNTLLQSSTPETNVLKTAGGKMRNKLNQRHQSTKNPEEMPEMLSLPSVPLPISSLPTISFGKKCDMKVNSHFPSGTKDFIFSNPIEHDLAVSNATPASYMLKPFVFSSPIEIEFPNTKEVLSLPVSSNANWNVTTSVAEWECTGCWVRNPTHKTTCLACDTPKKGESDSISSTTATTLSLESSKSFPLNSIPCSSLDSSTTWECSACWVKNPVKKSTCLACKTSRSTTHHTIIPSSSLCSSATWECSACWVRNSDKESTCLSCKTSRSTSQHITSLSIPVSKPSTWECSSCWVRNPVKEKKCLACETLHPEKDASPVFKGGFKFSSPVQNSPVTFKFGNCVNAVESTSPLNFSTTNSKSETVDASGFQFISSSDMLSTSTFKFGTSTISTAVPSCTSSTNNFVDATKMSEAPLPVSSSAGFKIPTIEISASDSKEPPISTNEGTSTANRSNISTHAMFAKKFDASNSLSASKFEVINASSDANIFKFATPNSSISVTDTTLGFKFKVPSTPAENTVTSSVNLKFGTTSENSSTTSNFNFGGNSTTSVTPTLGNFDAENESETSTFKLVAPSTSSVNAFFNSSASTATNKTSLSLPTTSSSTSTTLGLKSEVANIATENSATTTSLAKFGTSEHFSTTASFSLGGKSSVPITATSENFCAANESEIVTSTFKFPVPSTTSTNAFFSTAASTATGKTSEAVLTTTSTSTTSSFKFGVASTPPETTATTSILSLKFGTASENCTTASFNFGGSSSIPVTATRSNFGAASESETSSSFQFLTPSTTSVNTFLNSASTAKNSEALLATSVFKTPVTTVATSSVLQPEPTSNNLTSASSTVLTTPVFKFGTATTVSEGTPTTSVFKFGTASVDTTSASGFKFGVASNSTNSFFSTAAPITTSIAVPSNSSKAPEASGPSMSNSSTGFKMSSASMGTTNLKHHEQSSTIFGSSQTGFMSKGVEKSPTAPTLPPTGGFLFGAPKSEAQASVPFDFGPSSATSNTSAFSAFQPLQPITPNFQFGSQLIGNTTSAFGSAGSFTFAKASEVNPVSSLPNPVSAFGSSSPCTFSLGPKTDAPSQISSTVSQAPALPFGSPSVAFSFGNKVDSIAPQNPTPAFGLTVFGNAPTPSFCASDKPASSGFTFGTPSPSIFQFGANSEKKPAAPASGFTFGNPAHPETSNSFSGGFTMNTPPSFNFGATSTPAGPFQFAAPTPETTGSSQAVPRKYRKAVRRVRKD